MCSVTDSDFYRVDGKLEKLYTEKKNLQIEKEHIENKISMIEDEIYKTESTLEWIKCMILENGDPLPMGFKDLIWDLK